jgi:hypothetical protein
LLWQGFLAPKIETPHLMLRVRRFLFNAAAPAFASRRKRVPPARIINYLPGIFGRISLSGRI